MGKLGWKMSPSGNPKIWTYGRYYKLGDNFIKKHGAKIYRTICYDNLLKTITPCKKF